MIVIFLFGAGGVLWYMFNFDDHRWFFGVSLHILMGICLVVNYFEHEFKDSLYLIGLWGLLGVAHWAMIWESRNNLDR